eukprot:3004345-Prymnesium_polylepis.2
MRRALNRCHDKQQRAARLGWPTASPRREEGECTHERRHVGVALSQRGLRPPHQRLVIRHHAVHSAQLVLLGIVRALRLQRLLSHRPSARAVVICTRTAQRVQLGAHLARTQRDAAPTFGWVGERVRPEQAR